MHQSRLLNAQAPRAIRGREALRRAFVELLETKVNAIPGVCAAPPGIVTTADLPQVIARLS